MYKIKVQELCQQRRWELPAYTLGKQGPDHMPRFTATVVVHGQVFHTPTHTHCKSSKDAKNNAARIAFHNLMPSSSPQPLSIAVDPHPLPPTSSHPNPTPDTLHVYKYLLQQHAQKQSIGLPVYTFKAEGPLHARRFKSKVSINGKSYEPAEFFPTLKEAEQTAAKIACLSMNVVQEGISFYKSYLLELARRKGLLCPSYETVETGLCHEQRFMSTVEVGSCRFQGLKAKTIKQAEWNAAELAYAALTKGGRPTNCVSSVNRRPTTEKHTATTEKHHIAIDEDGPLNAKRAKCSPGNVDVNAHLHPSHGSKLEGSMSADSLSPSWRLR